MNAINNLINRTSNGISYGLEVTAYAMTHNEPLEKIAKISGRMIEITGIAFSYLSAAFSTFSSQIKDCVIVLESLRFLSISNYLFVPDDKGKYNLTKTTTSWQKCVDRVSLFFHTVFKSWKGLNRFGFVGLGILAKEAIGKLPIFTLIMDSFMLGSCSFGVWDSLGVNYPRVRGIIAKADSKLEKWENRLTDIVCLKANMEIECAHYEAKYERKTVELNERLENLEKKARLNEDTLLKAKEQNNLSKGDQQKIANCSAEQITLTRDIERVRAKQQQNDNRLAQIAEGNFKALAEDLEQKNIKHKLEKWEVVKENAQLEKSKIWLRVANSVGKFSVIVFALTLVATNFWTVPATLTLLVVGNVADSIGLAKLLAERFWKEKEIPVLATAATAA